MKFTRVIYFRICYVLFLWSHGNKEAKMFHPFYFTFNFLSISTKPGRLKWESVNTAHAVLSLNIVCYTYEIRDRILHCDHCNINESFAVKNDLQTESEWFAFSSNELELMSSSRIDSLSCRVFSLPIDPQDIILKLHFNSGLGLILNYTLKMLG